MQNSPERLPDVCLGPRVGLPGRRQPAGYGTSWSVLVIGTSGRSGSSEPNLFSPFPSTNLQWTINSTTWNHLRMMWEQPNVKRSRDEKKLWDEKERLNENT